MCNSVEEKKKRALQLYFYSLTKNSLISQLKVDLLTFTDTFNQVHGRDQQMALAQLSINRL